MDAILSIQKAGKMLGVTPKTLKLWDEQNKLKPYFKTSGGHRRYRLSDIDEFIGCNIIIKPRVFIYCRVSTKKQEDAGNLLRQEQRLVSYCQDKDYEIVSVFKEVASGINDNRRELIKMFKRLSDADKIIVEYNDRIARFGFNYLKEFANSYNVEIEAIENNIKLEPNEEMVNDLVSIVTCFSAKIYGVRGGKKIKKTLDELEIKRLEGSDISEDNSKINAD